MLKMEVVAAVTTTWLVPHPASSSSHPLVVAVAAAAAAARVYRSSSLKLVRGARSPAAIRRTVSCASFFSFSPAADAAAEECSVKRAFSSTVFIIREVQSFALRLTAAIFNQDLNYLIGHVREELHSSFTWLFQFVFSRTPVLMLCLMILLANFTVHSIPHTPTAEAAIVETSPAIRKKSVQVPRKIWAPGEEAAVGGGGGGSGKHRPVAGSTADGGDDLVFHRRRRLLVDDGEREAKLWEAIVEEAGGMSPEMVDHETMQMMVSPVKVELPVEDHSDYLQTELYYHLSVAQDPDNPLLLSNFAQFLYLVLHDHTRAEEYFKRAADARPPDAAALACYAGFLWVARRDMAAAEEMYLEAIAADPGNTYYAASYAHFLWNTGGEDTCFPHAGGGNDDNENCTGEYEE